ncbi:hypothetical protein LJC18_04975 [Lachnospiraceae bacterium OttesenSCG-928-E19]|nr:hypothetical protein [Lachnospiraceae bacterium OttesenSCG-928-E19]
MRKVLHLLLVAFVCIGSADAAVRDNTSVARATSTGTGATSTGRASSNANTRGTTTNVTERPTATSTRSATQPVSPRETTATTQPRATMVRSATTQTTPRTTVSGPRNIPIPSTARTNVKANTVTARAATDTTSTISETRTGAEYEQCKTAYFTCMDQFCKLKNDNYRRCSCSDRVYDFDDTKATLQDASEQLTAFTENLDTVGMTAAQATAMRKASEGENALTADGSASKALLQAIMNSIRGEDSTVGGKYADLNSINISFDTTNAFGMSDTGQAVAAYNGRNLYNAIYGQCRNAVRDQCNDASLQRAVTAYLMAVEQDCNTVQTSLEENRKKMKSAVREGSAMLDLARVENRQKHNSDDMTTCLNNVTAAIQSDEVCGNNYKKCLDNGEFIDISTGKPIAGVVRFYELEGLLKFADGVNIVDQKLSKIAGNRAFVQNFEKRVKKFAEPALDRCTEKADQVWEEYLDKAMIDIYYAQKSKVAEIKEGCFDFVSSCYVNGDNALTAAMKELLGDAAIVLQPDRITLNAAVCSEYVASCDNMFDGNIVKQYIDNRKTTDTLSACRAVAKQCFDKFGGTGYENFYYPSSGLFVAGYAPDWFTLCEGDDCKSYKSECAKQLAAIPSCSSREMMEQAFGGFDYLKDGDLYKYGLRQDNGTGIDERSLRPSGVATETYYQIIDILNTQCNNVQGRFVELQFLKKNMYRNDNICIANFGTSVADEYYYFKTLYGVADGEDMCPRDYVLSVDTKSWGACLCWENGARRSKNGKSVKCVPELPVSSSTNDGKSCTTGISNPPSSVPSGTTYWCTQIPEKMSDTNQVCPQITSSINTFGKCVWSGYEYVNTVEKIPAAIR